MDITQHKNSQNAQHLVVLEQNANVQMLQTHLHVVSILTLECSCCIIYNACSLKDLAVIQL